LSTPLIPAPGPAGRDRLEHEMQRGLSGLPR